MDSAPNRGRRRFLAYTAGAAASLIAAPAFAVPRVPLRRALALQHLHTGEKLDVVYWAEGRYQPGALHRINWLLRDFRTEDVHAIDPRLLDLLTSLRQRLRTKEPFQVISAYRSPATNEMLAATTEGVATNSLHLIGKAIDIRLPGRRLGELRRAAMGMKVGGVGYYPHSNFVHVDVGAVRHW